MRYGYEGIEAKHSTLYNNSRSEESGKNRDKLPDYIKGILTILMILSHIANVCGGGNNSFSKYVNLTTFSGFMFCFGYVCYMAYMTKESVPIKRLLLGFIKTIIAYYISAFMYLLLVNKSFLNIEQYLLQIKLAPYSEFLISWAYMYLVLTIGIPFLNRILKKGYLVFFAVLFSLGMTFVPYDLLDIPWLGPLIGKSTGNYFPIIQYSSYFLVGAYACKKKIKNNWWIMCSCVFSLMIFLLYCYRIQDLPARWQPHFVWIIGGYFFIYVYYLICKQMSNKTKKDLKILSFIGENTLSFLVISNFFVFLGKNLSVQKWEISFPLKLGVYYGIVLVACFGFTILGKIIHGIRISNSLYDSGE